MTGVDGQDFATAEVAKDENWIATVRQDWPGIASTPVDTITDCAPALLPPIRSSPCPVS